MSIFGSCKIRTNHNPQDGMGTNPWGDPCDTWWCPPLDLAKFIANGGVHQSHPQGGEHKRRTWEQNANKKYPRFQDWTKDMEKIKLN